MSENNKTVCPKCNEKGLIKLISAGSGIIISGREANQFRNIKDAKYWRDKNGDRHLVTAADGYSTSSTVKHQTATPEEVKDKIRKDRKAGGQMRKNYTSARAKIWNKEQVPQSDSPGDGIARFEPE